MTATDELRRLLDERGVKWDKGAFPNEARTYWQGVVARPWDEQRIYVTALLTPEQAIAATLGRGECRNISKIIDKYGQARFACSECEAWIDSRMLWNPECSNGESPWVKDCKLNYCPNCGRRIVEVDE